MATETNRFGTGVLEGADALVGKVWVVNTACLSIHAEFLSWANANAERIARAESAADTLVVLGCQVTDLAVLNDLRTLGALMHRRPGKNYFVGGCLARRFDIELPGGVRRLGRVVCDGQELWYQALVQWADPFWVSNFDPANGSLAPGHLFRRRYPLRTSVGCSGCCTYCTIRETRGEPYTLPVNEEEFLGHNDVVLVADSPSAEELATWMELALRHERTLSLRNVEPRVAMQLEALISVLARRGLLKVFHMPVQAEDEAVLRDMGRGYSTTNRAIDLAGQLPRSVTTATNIIVDYKDCPNRFERIYRVFDYVSWNPWWCGVWDRASAERRWRRYFGV